ncbi:hypothetical protein [Alteromonas stellipolaris]|uniref:hypothetical protein n=1 Tax=Alteromonas stellipolaris TaxID=233316 RepID=UPI0007B4310E|nr:hypothetical protein [Alteromonas stellipolaris]ANB22199.1 hypothetical protein A6K25_13485 [Alteromonas stellipolaris]MDP2596578.1 hypothetical protein [Alteromonas stellipolaris]
MKKILTIGLICFLTVSTILQLHENPIRCGGTIVTSTCTEYELEFMGLKYTQSDFEGTLIHIADYDFVGAIILFLILLTFVFFVGFYKLVKHKYWHKREE